MQITFPYDQAKATQVLLWLLQRHGGVLDRMKLLKLVFFVDRAHLARHGRPVVGGQYYAMPYGPVASELYDSIKRAVSPDGPYLSIGDRVYAQAALNEDLLSESDVKVLEEVDDSYGLMDTFRLSRITHDLRAYKKNEPQGRTSKPLPYEDFFIDLEDQTMLEIIQEDQEARDVLE